MYQRAIADGNILCVDGKKADLRMYILVEPSAQQHVYVYNDAVVRVAPHTYQGNSDTSLEAQLTNVATGGHIVSGQTWEPFPKQFQDIKALLRRKLNPIYPYSHISAV